MQYFFNFFSNAAKSMRFGSENGHIFAVKSKECSILGCENGHIFDIKRTT